MSLCTVIFIDKEVCSVVCYVVMYQVVLYIQYINVASVISLNAWAEWLAVDIVCDNRDLKFSNIARH